MTKTAKKSEMACNSPKRTPDHDSKSHIVKACLPCSSASRNALPAVMST